MPLKRAVAAKKSTSSSATSHRGAQVLDAAMGIGTNTLELATITWEDDDSDGTETTYQQFVD